MLTFSVTFQCVLDPLQKSKSDSGMDDTTIRFKEKKNF